MEFEPCYDLKEYAEDIYKRRKESTNSFERVALKFLLNSLYGKFAESNIKTTLHINPDEEALKDLTKDLMVMPGVYLEPREVKVSHMHVPISAHITARARKTLYEFMIQSSECYYCDTDGFATPDNFETSNELGGLKLEKKIVSGHFVAPKVYRLDGSLLTRSGDWVAGTIVKAKGFSLNKGSTRNLTEAEVARGEHGLASDHAIERYDTLVSGQELEIERMSRLRGNLKRGVVSPCETTILKGLRNPFPKRKMFENGKSRPWTIKELRAYYKIEVDSGEEESW